MHTAARNTRVESYRGMGHYFYKEDLFHCGGFKIQGGHAILDQILYILWQNRAKIFLNIEIGTEF